MLRRWNPITCAAVLFPLCFLPLMAASSANICRELNHREWLDACKGGPSPSSDFQYGAALTEVGLLGLVAMRVGKKISWDAKAMKCPNAPEADRFLKESYRAGWELPV